MLKIREEGIDPEQARADPGLPQMAGIASLCSADPGLPAGSFQQLEATERLFLHFQESFPEQARADSRNTKRQR